jgi:hypothetical protein
VQYEQQANPFLSMHSNTPLVISGNDKNKQLTLLGHRKQALTATDTLVALKKHQRPLKIKKKQRLPLFEPSSVNFCQNLLNLSHETVPVRREIKHRSGLALASEAAN